MTRRSRAILSGGGFIILIITTSLLTGVIEFGPTAAVSDPEALRILAVSRLPRTLGSFAEECEILR